MAIVSLLWKILIETKMMGSCILNIFKSPLFVLTLLGASLLKTEYSVNILK